jgi:hypothetical protein
MKKKPVPNPDRQLQNRYKFLSVPYIIQHLVFHEHKIREVKKTVFWNRNDLLRLRFLLWKSFGSGFGSCSCSGQNIAFSILEAALFPRKLASNF